MQKVIQNLNMKFSALILSAILVASITMIASNSKPAYAAFSVIMGNFETCATTPCVNTITGLGFPPKALILLTSNAYLPDPPSYDAEYNLQIGFSDGTNDRSIAAVSEDASNPTDACRTNSETIGKTLQPFCNFIEGDGEASFQTDGFKITWSDPIGVGAFAQYIALGGADLTDVKVGTLPTPTNVTGNKAYTGLGFKPDFIMFLYNRQSGTGVSDHAGFGMGFATSSTERGALMGVSEDGRTTSDTARAQRTDRVIYQLSPGNTANVDAQADFVSFDTDGFTLNWSDLPTDANDKFHYMAMKGGKYKVGSFNQKTTGAAATCPAPPPNCTQSISVGFQPTGLFLSSFNNAVSSSIQSHNRISFGFSHVTTEGATWAGDRDNIASNTYVAGYFHNSKVIRLATEAQTAGSSTTNAEADVQSFDTNGEFTLNWTTADTTAREILYVAFGNA